MEHVAVIHEDPFLIQPLLNDIATIFKKALEWDRKELSTFKNTMALFQYELAHAMPFKRGSATICKWIESALYLYHGYKITHNPKKMIDLEAMSNALPTFIKNYDSYIELKPITS